MAGHDSGTRAPRPEYVDAEFARIVDAEQRIERAWLEFCRRLDRTRSSERRAAGQGVAGTDSVASEAVLEFQITDGELMSSLAAQAEAANVTDAAIVSLIGAADEFSVSTMPADNAEADVVSSYHLPAEIHGSGEIRGGAVHIHATFAVHGDRPVAGHVHAAHIRTHFVRAYVIPMPSPAEGGSRSAGGIS